MVFAQVVPMPSLPPAEHLALLIKSKRRVTKLGLRATAQECGLSAATLSRLERGAAVSLPDAASLTKLAAWLNTTVGVLLGEEAGKTGIGNASEASTPEIVEVHLRADKNLSPETAKALATMFKALYEQVADGRFRRS